MPNLVRCLTLALVASVLTLVGQPARADVVLRDHIELPVSSVNQLLSLPGTNQLAVTSWDGEVTVVDPSTKEVKTVPGTIGTGRLTPSITGDRLYGATMKGGSITEIDVRSMTSRSWSVSGCPTDAVARQDAIYYFRADLPSCNQWNTLMRLDPATGRTETAGLIAYQPRIVSVPGANHFLVVQSDISPPGTSVVDVAADGQVSTVASNGAGGRAFITEEGDSAVIGNAEYSLPDLELLDPDVGIGTEFGVHGTQASTSLVTSVNPDWSYVSIRRRDDASLINRFSPPAARGGLVVDARVDEGTLYTIANSTTGSAWLYANANPAERASEVTITATSDGPYFPGKSVKLSGTLTHDGSPIAEAPVRVSLERPSQRTLATVTTDATGAWQYDFVPEAGGLQTLQASHMSNGHETFDTVRFTVARTPATLTLSGPTSSQPLSPITVNGELRADGEGVGGRALGIEPYCLSGSFSLPTAQTVTADDGTFSFTYTPKPEEPCGKYEFRAFLIDDPVYTDVVARHTTAVSGRRAEVSFSLPRSALVGDEVTGVVTVSVDGATSGGESVRVTINHPDHTTKTYYDGVTADDGTLQVPFAPPVKGPYTLIARRHTTSDTVGATETAWLEASQVGTSLGIGSTPTSVALGDSVNLRGLLSRVDGDNGGAEVRLIATDANGVSRNLTSTTDSQGYVEFVDEPESVGNTDYALVYAGDNRYEPAPRQHTTVEVTPFSPLVPTVSLRADHTSYTAGQLAKFTVGVTGSETRQIVVTATRSGSAPVVLFEGRLPAGGLVLTRSMKHTETITAKHPADARHTARQVSISRTVRLGLATVATRPLERIGRSAVYRRTADPTFVTTSRPSRPGACLRMQLQKYVDGAWRTVKTSTCRAVHADGKAAWTLTGWQTPGVPFRTHAVFAGDRLNAASTGTWAYFRFR